MFITCIFLLCKSKTCELVELLLTGQLCTHQSFMIWNRSEKILFWWYSHETTLQWYFWKKCPLSYSCHFRGILKIHATEPFKYAFSCVHSEYGRMFVIMTNEWLSRSILNKYIFFRSLWKSFQVTWYSKNYFGTIMYQCASKAKFPRELFLVK